MAERISLPPKIENINHETLKKALARGQFELYKNVKWGEKPFFGYPFMQYSPDSSFDIDDDPSTRIRKIIYN